MSHGEVTAGNCRNGSPASGVVVDEQDDDDDDDDDDGGDEGADAPGHSAEDLVALGGEVAGTVVDVGEDVTEEGAEHAVDAAGTQQAGDGVPRGDTPRPRLHPLATASRHSRFILLYHHHHHHHQNHHHYYQGGICRGKPGNFPHTGSDLPSHWFV